MYGRCTWTRGSSNWPENTARYNHLKQTVMYQNNFIDCFGICCVLANIFTSKLLPLAYQMPFCMDRKRAIIEIKTKNHGYL